MAFSFDSTLVHLLHRALQNSTEIFMTDSKHGLTPRQYIILEAIAENEGLKQSDIVERSGIDRSTMGDVVLRMIKSGLLQRRRSKSDARAYKITLTEKGRKLLDQAKITAEITDKIMLGSLSTAKCTDLRYQLKFLARNLDADLKR
jgi:MarR family transcriptional regulator, temperature-dependent positive regulator of motility